MPNDADYVPTHKRQIGRLPQWLAFPIGTLLFCLLACGGLFLFIERPQYIELKTVPPDNIRWHYIETSVQVWGESKYFIGRRETTIWCCNSTLESLQAILDYFNKSLVQEGWTLVTDGGNPCALTPEDHFLERGTDYFVYKRPNSELYVDVPTVCIAIWSVKGSSVRGVHVVLSTINPSFLTMLYDGLD